MIVEDSRLARLELKKQLKAFNDISLVGEAATSTEARELMLEKAPDIIFLDINLPGGDGFSFIRSLDYEPLIIFTTAYSEYAVEAFDVNAVDYILKPVEVDRLADAIEKCRKLKQNKDNAIPTNINKNQFFIKDGDKCYIVKLEKVRYFQGIGNYCKVHFEDKHPMLLSSLNKLEESLDSQVFFRANRQQLINLNYIEKVEPSFNGRLDLRMSCGKVVEVSVRQSSQLKQLLSL